MKGTAGLTAFAALILGATVYLILFFLQVTDALLYASVITAVTYVLLSAVLRILASKQNKRYALLEKELIPEYWHKAQGDWDTGVQSKSGYIYFCENGIFCLCLEKKSHVVDPILTQDIARMDHDDAHLQILTKDGKRYILTLPNAQHIQQLLQDKSPLQ